MKKKIFAALTAGLMLCGMLTAPVSAAETEVQMGDVNMDGAVDIADAQLVLADYVHLMCFSESKLTEEQQALGNVDNKTSTMKLKHMDEPVMLQADLQDAVLILGYYTKHLTDENLTLDEYLKSRLTNQ